MSYWPGFGDLLGLYVQVKGTPAIGLHQLLARPSRARLQRVILAHELGHHVLHAGTFIARFYCGIDRTVVGHLEAAAEQGAAGHLLPREVVLNLFHTAGQVGPEEVETLADWADVPFGFVEWWCNELQRERLVPGAYITHPRVWAPSAIDE